jgi:organic hydroperoxide reductase OsmC/OhrA
MAGSTHEYAAALEWCGNNGTGTRRYEDYGRQFDALVEGKPVLRGSADPAFRGDASVYNPEDLLLIAISSCHMLSYLALCARHRICVVAYSDRAEAVMETGPDGGGRFTRAVLHPRVSIEDSRGLGMAVALHEQAHRLCFIANSCNFPIEHRATVEPLDGGAAADARPGERAP